MPTFVVALEDRGRQRGRVAHHRHHAHALGAGGDHHVGLADADAVGRHLHGGQARGAEAVDGDAADALGQAGQHRADARDVQALLRLGNGAAADDVLDRLRVEPGHLRQRRPQRGAPAGRPAGCCGRSRGASGRWACGWRRRCRRPGLACSLRVLQLRTGLPVYSIAMIRSCVFGCSQQLAEAPALHLHQVLLVHRDARVHVAAAHHLGDQRATWKSCALMKPPSRMLTSSTLIVGIAFGRRPGSVAFTAARSRSRSSPHLLLRDVEQLVLVRHDDVAPEQVAGFRSRRALVRPWPSPRW